MSVQLKNALDDLTRAQSEYSRCLRRVREEVDRMTGHPTPTKHEDVIQAAADEFCVTPESMRMQGRTGPCVDARHAACYILRTVRGVPGREISRMFDRSESYGFNMLKNARERMSWDKKFKGTVQKLIRETKQNNGGQP